MRRSFCGLALLLATLGLSACAASAVVGGMMLGSIMYTDKLPTDILAERQTGMECNLLESWKDNARAYCEPPEETLSQRELEEVRSDYCYSSIGGVTCYDRPDPYGDGKALVR